MIRLVKKRSRIISAESVQIKEDQINLSVGSHVYHMMIKVVRSDLRSITGIRARSMDPFVNAVDRDGIVNSVKFISPISQTGVKIAHRIFLSPTVRLLGLG